ncbi:hypothetical protein [Streptomyces sp. NBC_00459]|uniref:hypothetical protein n=1 Tax=Streptomyces sp. NBC_00459 TaxID=2975749 RepID=UPI002E16B734
MMWIVLLVICAVLVGWYSLFPCCPNKLRYTFWFGAGEREARQELAKGRADSRSIRDGADERFGKVKAAADEYLRPWTERLQTLRGEQRTLHAEAQKPGEAVGAPLGPAKAPAEWLQLHDHVLASLKRVRSETGETRYERGGSLALEGLEIETRTDRNHHICLRVTLPGGQNRVREWLYPDTADWEIRLHAFVESVREQIAFDYDCRAAWRARDNQYADAIRQAEADHQDALAKVDRKIDEAERRRNKEHAEADRVRGEACKAWVDDAGGLRPRMWW